MSNTAASLMQRSVEATAKYLVRKGYELVDRGFEGPAGTVDLIATDEDTLVFVNISARSADENGFPSSNITDEARTAFELNAIEFLRSYEETDIAVRADIVDIVVINEDHALLRHHIGAIGAIGAA